jgi:hypothetical protein
MNLCRIPLLACALAAGALATVGGPARTQEPAAEDRGVDVQARGPVHEAYAEPAETQPQPSPVITRQPSDPVDEQPPDQRPEGDNIVWIPGYWAWEDATRDFIWVSGFWRDVPPGRQWVPGHWQQVEEGWQWVPGYWANSDAQEVTYVPPPPPSIDRGPSTPAADENSIYVPGCWVYRTERFLWRPGYWMAYRPGWVWIPAHYLWTPTGCVFVNGYWDYPLDQRGLLFAPVRIVRRFLRREGWFYVPRYVVQPDFLISALFVRPAYYSYYFGDYFEPRYRRLGFVSWIDYRVNRVGFDPNFGYYRRAFARYPEWERNLRRLYVGRRDGSIPRPPLTLAQQTEVVSRQAGGRRGTIGLSSVQNVRALVPLNRVNTMRVTNLLSLTGVRNARVEAGRAAASVIRLARVSPRERAAFHRGAVQLRKVAAERRRGEARLLSQGAVPVRHTDRPRTVRVPLPRPERPQEGARPRREVPPLPRAPRSETRSIPRYEPRQPARPPLRDSARPPRDTRPLRDDGRPGRDARPPRDTRPPRDARPPRDNVRPRRDRLPPRDTRPPRDARPTGREPPPRDTRPRDARPPRDNVRPRRDAPPRDARPTGREPPPRRVQPPRDNRPPRDARPDRRGTPPPDRKVSPPPDRRDRRPPDRKDRNPPPRDKKPPQ